MTVKDAHAAHAVALGKVLEGVDPGAERAIRRERDRTAPTVADLVADYPGKYARIQKRSWKQDQTILERELVGTDRDPGPWRSLKAKAIQRRDVVELLNAIVERGCPIKANRTLAVTRRMFGWAVEQDLLEHSPCEHIRPAVRGESPREVPDRVGGSDLLGRRSGRPIIRTGRAWRSL